jgi:alcohol dehydrogenase (NADP+)
VKPRVSGSLTLLDGTLVNVGTLEALNGLDGRRWRGAARASPARSSAASPRRRRSWTRAARGIKADVEVVRAHDVNCAFERVAKDVRYRRHGMVSLEEVD